MSRASICLYSLQNEISDLISRCMLQHQSSIVILSEIVKLVSHEFHASSAARVSDVFRTTSADITGCGPYCELLISCQGCELHKYGGFFIASQVCVNYIEGVVSRETLPNAGSTLVGVIDRKFLHQVNDRWQRAKSVSCITSPLTDPIDERVVSTCKYSLSLPVIALPGHCGPFLCS